MFGTIIAPADPRVWDGLNRRQWLRFKEVDDLTVEGGGTFYGSGEQWWAESCKIKKTNVKEANSHLHKISAALIANFGLPFAPLISRLICGRKSRTKLSWFALNI